MQIQESSEAQLTKIESAIERKWGEILGSSRLVRSIMTDGLRIELYTIYMLETFHYTAHNARNQAAAGIQHAAHNAMYAKFCFEHAAEETGHEKMALHDLRALGIAVDEESLPPPLPETETLIGYLYWISTNGNPYRRLGYSLWAESSYQYINPIVSKVQETLSLTDSQLTFFRAHSEIDDEHAKQVRQTILRTCKKEEDWVALRDVALTSLDLTGRMLEGVYNDYRQLQDGVSPRFGSTLSLSHVKAVA